MPEIGARAPRDCHDCGRAMYWTEGAVRGPDLLARRAVPQGDANAVLDAYRCSDGHTSVECPVCGSYETASWADPEGASHYHVICDACGNDSVSPM